MAKAYKQIRIKIPAEIHKQIKVQAAECGITLAKRIIEILKSVAVEINKIKTMKNLLALIALFIATSAFALSSCITNVIIVITDTNAYMTANGSTNYTHGLHLTQAQGGEFISPDCTGGGATMTIEVYPCPDSETTVGYIYPQCDQHITCHGDPCPASGQSMPIVVPAHCYEVTFTFTSNFYTCCMVALCPSSGSYCAQGPGCP